LQQGYQRALLIGSDAPDLPLGLVEQAIIALRQSEVVLVPATDGGYVLIGESNHHPELFRAIPWSSGEVLATTLERVAQHGIRAVTLGSWEDLDDLPSLARLLQRSPRSKVAVHLRQHLGRLFPGLRSAAT
jgi:glycosyltransferase A (GT-A) superfamily protein (DUF2064 family)